MDRTVVPWLQASTCSIAARSRFLQFGTLPRRLKDLHRPTPSRGKNLVDRKGFSRRLYANRFALDYAGITLEEFQSEDYERKFIHPDDLERMKSENPILRGETYEFETRIRGQDQIYRWFLVRFLPLRDSEGRILRWYSSWTEIQDRKEAEERAQNKMETLPYAKRSTR